MTLKKNSLNEKDTFFVQLRCHAAVIRKDKEKPWHCCLYIGESASESSTYPVSEFLELLLSKIHAKNIILVADICDLKSSPQFGLFVNPVATYTELSGRYKAPHLRGPFNLDARRAAGFDDEELAALQR